MEIPAHILLRDRIRGIVEPTVVEAGCELVAVEITSADKGQTLRLFVDTGEGVGIDHFAGAYRLEVSSPGIDRPVETPEDFERFTGLRVKVRLISGAARRRYSGTLLGMFDEHVRVEVDGESFDLSLHEIDRARLVLDLDEFAALKSRKGHAPEPSTVTS